MDDVADDRYDEGYWERGEGSNYVAYSDDPGWPLTVGALSFATRMVEPTLLEFGCAKGWFLHHAVEGGFDAYGVDPSRWALAHPAPGVEGRMELGNAQTHTDAQADVVCSWEVLEHIEETEVDEALANMWAHVKPGGLFVHRICLPGAMHDEDHTHVTVRPRSWWADRIAEDLPDAERAREVEDLLDQVFRGRDWAGRFFAYRRSA